MKLGVVAPYADPSRGGHEQFLLRLLRGFLTRNVEVTLFSRRFETVRRKLPSVTPVHVPRIPVPQFLRYLSFNHFARRAVQNHDAPLDVLFTTGFVTFGDCYRAGGGLHRTFMQHRDPRWLPKPTDWAKNYLQDRLFSSNDARTYIVNSNMVRRELTQEYPHLSGRVETVYNGVDTERYHPEGRPTDRRWLEEKADLGPDVPRLLFVGREPRRKGLDRLLEALDAMRRTVHLVVAGISREEVQAVAGDFDGWDSLTILDYVEAMPRLYRAVDLTVLPTRYDPASNVIPESLACGTPVVTTARNGAREFVEEGVNGVVLEDPGAGSLAACLDRFLNRKTTLHEWSPDGDFLAHLDIDRTVRQIHQVLQTHVNRSG